MSKYNDLTDHDKKRLITKSNYYKKLLANHVEDASRELPAEVVLDIVSSLMAATALELLNLDLNSAEDLCNTIKEDMLHKLTGYLEKKALKEDSVDSSVLN